MNARAKFLLLPAVILAASLQFAAADPSDLLFTVQIDGSGNTPTLRVTNNSPVLEITQFKFTIGDTTKNFDGNYGSVSNPPGGTAERTKPLAGQRTDELIVKLTGFGPGETFTVSVDIDQDANPPDQVLNYATVFFSNGGKANSVATVYAGVAYASRTLPETPVPLEGNIYRVRGPGRSLQIYSQAEGEADEVVGVTVTQDGTKIADNVGSLNVEVAHGDRIQITVPPEVYKDIHGEYITDSGEIDPERIENDAEERFVATGMSVNNVPQTADPTFYDFEITGDTNVQVKWGHYYALTIRQDFSKTQSIEVIAGTPWAGPLASDAAGNPDPPVSKRWVMRGSQPVVQIDGQAVDNFSHPGLDIRYMVKGYRAYGPPNNQVTPTQNEARFPENGGVDIRQSREGTILSFAASGGTATAISSGVIENGIPVPANHGLVTGSLIEISGCGYMPYNGVHTITCINDTSFSIPVIFPPSGGNPVSKGVWRDITYVRTFLFPTVESRQQVQPAFTMYCPAGITYVWQIQYGVRVNADDVSRTDLARVYEITSAGDVDRTVQDGISWFDPGTKIKVVAAAQEPGADGLSLTGWANGDGYYFAAQGEIDPSSGLPTSGAPATVNGSPVATWLASGPDGSRGYQINNLQRPARVLWRFGAGVIVVYATIGQHVFANYPEYAAVFVQSPQPITDAQPDPVAIAPNVAPPGAELMAEWDPVSARLYPTIPGRFTVPWVPGTNGVNPIEVRVVASLPYDNERKIRGHYPHINGTPAVALDPDPNDDFDFRSIKYTTAGATVDADGNFTTERSGVSILLFSRLQLVGRGEPRQFLTVRVVDTRSWDANLPSDPTIVQVGRKIVDPEVDLAKLGTGYLIDPTGRARYNPFIYDGSKLEGLAARDVYDMNQLRADSSSLVIVNKAALPGPVITVNEQPGVPDRELPAIVWYDDPRRNETLLWPYLARIYRPVWPQSANVPQIVIASQFGSDGLSPDTMEQATAPAIGQYPEATSYDPSRLQEVQIYQQPDFDQPGYNPNEEHALVAPSLRFANVSPRPPAIYALRDGDLNYSNRTVTTGDGRYTSHPFVLVQFLDAADDEYKMNVYRVLKESGSGDEPAYRFANNFTASPTSLKSQPYVKMEAGEPVIPFYPLGVVIGASPAPETFGNNLFTQEAYWEDWRGSSWAISGGRNAWFTVSFYYPLAPDFWWPGTVQTPPVKVLKDGATYTAVYDDSRQPAVPGVGDSVAFLPESVHAVVSTIIDSHLPTKVIYKSEWPDNPPILKAGETLTFSGGEYRSDFPTTKRVVDGEEQTVETPGLPQVLAFASAEVVFDSLNPEALPDDLDDNWTARVVQVLDRRTVPLPVGSFPSELQPAGGRTTVKQGKYIFNELPASLQRRLRYDPLAMRTVTGGDGTVNQVPGVLEFSGLLNDKAIGDASLTASPPAVYVLEPNILTADERDAVIDLIDPASSQRSTWEAAVDALYAVTRNPEVVPGPEDGYLAGLMRKPQLGPDGQILKDQLGNVLYESPALPAQLRAYGPGLALVPNAGFLDPLGTLANGDGYPDESWVTMVENNDPSLGGSPITPHIIKIDRRFRYRGSIKTVLSDNVFDENIVLRSTGDFGANAAELVFEWWYRPDDGSTNVPPPDLIPAGQTNPWKLFPDPTGNAGRGRYQMTLKGNPNAPEALLADTWWFLRYRHKNDNASGTNWKITQPDGGSGVNFTWAGAGNSQPFVDANLDGIPDYRAQLAQGWIKRVLDAVNPYEARIRDFDGDNPSTVASMIAQFGARYEGPVALNPDKNVIENVGLIELYETILNRGRNLSIDLSQPVSTPAISNALQLASTRVSDFYTLLGNEAYGDALDPTIGYGSDSAEYGVLATSVFAFQNQLPSLIDEELALLRGVDDYLARPYYNRLFPNFTKGEGEAAYATNYNISDVNFDGFLDEEDAMKLFPQGHGDAWGHYLTAMRNQYDLLRHPYFNWVSRSESYNLQDIVISVDFLDERKFAAAAAAKAKTGAEIVSLTYRDRYVADPTGQWQGYTDTNADRAWGVDGWSRRAGQGAYFDWVTANALLPAVHPNQTLEGIQKVDRTTNADIAVVSANLNSIQRTMDQADRGYNPLGIVAGAQVFDLDPMFEYFGEYGAGTLGKLHFDQIHERAGGMIENATASWDRANTSSEMLRRLGNSEAEFRNATFQEDLSFRNRLIQIFGKPYEGTIGPGKLYPAGYEGPDLGLYMYVPVRHVNRDTVPGPAAAFAEFGEDGLLAGGDLYNAFLAADPDGSGPTILNKENALSDVDVGIRRLFSASFASASDTLTYGADTTTGMFAVNYTDLDNPKVDLENFINQMPVTAAGYTFQAPPDWGARGATGELQDLINQMIQQEAEIAKAVGEWDALSGEIVRILRMINSKLTSSGVNQGREEIFSRTKMAVNDTIKVIETAKQMFKAAEDLTWELKEATVEGVPVELPTLGLAISPGDALSLARAGIEFTATGTRAGLRTSDNALTIVKLIAEIGLEVAENELNLAKADRDRTGDIREWLKELEDKIGDEPVKRIGIFKEMEALRALSDKYRTLLDEGARLVDERAAYNKRVAAQTQSGRYQDMTFRVARNHALQTYRSSFDLASRYAYLAVSAYDYETNYSPVDPASATDAYGRVIRARSLDELERTLEQLKQNYDSQRALLGLNNPQRETGEISMRRELFRILPAGETQPDLPANEFPAPGEDSDAVWRRQLQNARVADLWQLPEFRNNCRAFAAATDAAGNPIPQPGIVLPFSSDISSGKNFFGKPLSGGDQAYSTSNFATKVVGVGVAFMGYRTDDILNDLAAAPRIYLIPAGLDIMRVSRSDNPDELRAWKVVEQAIPVPFPAGDSNIEASGYIPLLDALNGRFGGQRHFSDFRAYPEQLGDGVKDTRLVGRSIWNTRWVLIIPGATLHADPEVGLDRFVDQVTDIKLIFDTYGQSGG